MLKNIRFLFSNKGLHSFQKQTRLKNQKQTPLQAPLQNPIKIYPLKLSLPTLFGLQALPLIYQTLTLASLNPLSSLYNLHLSRLSLIAAASLNIHNYGMFATGCRTPKQTQAYRRWCVASAIISLSSYYFFPGLPTSVLLFLMNMVSSRMQITWSPEVQYLADQSQQSTAKAQALQDPEDFGWALMLIRTRRLVFIFVVTFLIYFSVLPFAQRRQQLGQLKRYQEDCKPPVQTKPTQSQQLPK